MATVSTLRNSYQLPELTDLEVQWLFNGAPIPGAKGESLLLGPVRANDAGVYTYSVRSRFGTNQDSVWLIVASAQASPNAPIFTSWPQDTILTNGDSVQFDVDVDVEGAAPADISVVLLLFGDKFLCCLHQPHLAPESSFHIQRLFGGRRQSLRGRLLSQV